MWKGNYQPMAGGYVVHLILPPNVAANPPMLIAPLLPQKPTCRVVAPTDAAGVGPSSTDNGS